MAQWVLQKGGGASSVQQRRVHANLLKLQLPQRAPHTAQEILRHLNRRHNRISNKRFISQDKQYSPQCLNPQAFLSLLLPTLR